MPHTDWLKASARTGSRRRSETRCGLEHRIAELEEKLEECRSRLNPQTPGIPNASFSQA
jgi:hypothetical protein